MKCLCIEQLKERKKKIDLSFAAFRSTHTALAAAPPSNSHAHGHRHTHTHSARTTAADALERRKSVVSWRNLFCRGLAVSGKKNKAQFVTVSGYV